MEMPLQNRKIMIHYVTGSEEIHRPDIILIMILSNPYFFSY